MTNQISNSFDQLAGVHGDHDQAGAQGFIRPLVALTQAVATDVMRPETKMEPASELAAKLLRAYAGNLDKNTSSEGSLLVDAVRKTDAFAKIVGSPAAETNAAMTKIGQLLLWSPTLAHEGQRKAVVDFCDQLTKALNPKALYIPKL